MSVSLWRHLREFTSLEMELKVKDGQPPRSVEDTNIDVVAFRQ
jgi:hypothetical protein